MTKATPSKKIAYLMGTLLGIIFIYLFEKAVYCERVMPLNCEPKGIWTLQSLQRFKIKTIVD